MQLEKQMENERIEKLEQELALIKQRNFRVEADKAWETSVFRISSICIVTYIVAATVMYFIGVEKYWLNAFVPTLGFFLSARSLRFIKRWWIRSRFSP